MERPFQCHVIILTFKNHVALSSALTGSFLRKRWLKTPHSWLNLSAILTRLLPRLFTRIRSFCCSSFRASLKEVAFSPACACNWVAATENSFFHPHRLLKYISADHSATAELDSGSKIFFVWKAFNSLI